MNSASIIANVFSIAAIVCYVVAAMRQYTLLQARPASPAMEAGFIDSGKPASISVPIASIAVACHLVSVVIAGFSNGSIGASFFEVASATSLAVMIVALLSSRVLPGLIVPLALVAAMFMLLNLWLGHFTPLAELDSATSAHIALSMTAYGVLCVASVAALILLLSERAIRQGRQSSWLSRMPPLEVIEKFLFRLVAIGWLLLGAGLVVGAVAIDNFFAQHLAHKTFFSVLSWLLFGALLLGRWRAGWRGTTAVKLTLFAFILLIAAFLGSKFVLDVVLHRI